MIERAGFLGLDLGTDTGWCREKPGAPPKLGTWNLRAPSKHPGAPFANLIDYLFDACEEDPPEKILYEAPFMMIPKADEEGRGGNAATLERLISLTVPVKIVSFRMSIPVFLVAVSSARKAFCDNGRAKKPEVFQEAVRRGWKPNNEHESDAAAVVDYAIQLFHAEEWARANPQLAVARAQRRKR